MASANFERFRTLTPEIIEAQLQQQASFLKSNKGKPANFSHYDLTDYDFSGKNLTGALFFGANLENANFKDCILDHAQFESADAMRANFSRSSLRGANFTEARLTDAFFLEANLEDAILSVVNAQGAVFIAANLSHVNCFDAAFLDADFSFANLYNVALNCSDLTRARFHHTNLHKFGCEDALLANIHGPILSIGPGGPYRETVIAFPVDGQIHINCLHHRGPIDKLNCEDDLPDRQQFLNWAIQNIRSFAENEKWPCGQPKFTLQVVSLNNTCEVKPLAATSLHDAFKEVEKIAQNFDDQLRQSQGTDDKDNKIKHLFLQVEGIPTKYGDGQILAALNPIADENGQRKWRYQLPNTSNPLIQEEPKEGASKIPEPKRPRA